MTMEKNFNSKEVKIISSQEQKNMFVPGFKYILGQTIYRVTKAFKEDNTEMRHLVNDEGVIEVVTVETIIKDSREHDFYVIDDGKPKESIKKISKKKVKKITPKKVKNGRKNSKNRNS